MNSAIITGAACLAIGVGVGWSVKPSSSDDNKEESGASTTIGERGGAKVSGLPESSPVPSKSSREPGSAGAEGETGEQPWNAPEPGEGAGSFGGIVFQEVDPEEQRREHLKREERTKRSHELQIASLARRLNLTSEQQEELRDTHFAGLIERDRYYNLPGEMPEDPPEVPKEFLTPEQVAEFRHHLEQSYQNGPFHYSPPDLYLPPLER